MVRSLPVPRVQARGCLQQLTQTRSHSLPSFASLFPGSVPGLPPVPGSCTGSSAYLHCRVCACALGGLGVTSWSVGVALC